MKTKNNFYIEKKAKTYLEQVEERELEINRRLKIPLDNQRKISDYEGKSKDYWIKYNRAKTSEKTMFYMLLDELLEIIPQPSNSNGRPPVPVRDLIFCACLKLYNGFSARRIKSDLDHAFKMGFIEKTPHFNTLLNFMKDKSTSDILKYLITFSAMPLSAIEDSFAMDASGFGSYQYERWMRTRFSKGSEKGWRNYVKLHINVGIKTHIITAGEVTYGNTHDTTQLPYLVKQTSANFNAKKYMADKAYSSRRNFEIISELNALPIIPFKSNASGKKNGCPIWSAMYNFFNNNQIEFKYHYGQRAQSESTFSQIKRNFGEFLKMKTFDGQKNEVLLKCICHNISCLVNELFQRKIKIDFDCYADKIITCENEAI